jgi:hypothetical protein
MLNPIQKEFHADLKIEARANRPNPHHLRRLRNLNMGMDFPYH